MRAVPGGSAEPDSCELRDAELPRVLAHMAAQVALAFKALINPDSILAISPSLALKLK